MTSTRNIGGLTAHSFIIKEISKCYDSDSRVSDFFMLTQPEPVLDFDGTIPYSQSDISELSGKYEKGNVIGNRTTQSDLIFYPMEVQNLIQTSAERAFLGYFQQCKTFYCIADNKFVLWTEDNNISTIEDQDIITACDVAYPNAESFETKNVTALLIYSTVSSINLVPLGKNGKCFMKVETKTSFMPTAIRCSRSPNDFSIFVGSNTGDIFGLFYKLNQTRGILEMKLRNLSSNIFLSIIPKFLRFSNPIISLCYEESTSFLAAMDSQSNIRFYKYDKGVLNEVSNYEPQKDGVNNEQFVSIDSVPISDSDFTRFVAITSNGERLFFGTNPGVFLNDEIKRLQKMFVPQPFVGQQLIGGRFFLNVSVFVYQNSIVFIRPFYKPHQPTVNPAESYQKFEFEMNALDFLASNHSYTNQTFKLFYHELMWEHISSSPDCYLMGTEGYYKFTINRPVDTLKKMIEDFKGHFSDPIREWMTFFEDEAESPATLLLLSTESPNSQRWALSILHQYSSLVMKNRNAYDTSLSPACSAFIQRASRLLSIFWETPVFTKEKNKYVLSKIFRKLPSNLITSIKSLIDISSEYTKIKRALSEISNAEQRKEDTDETNVFTKLCAYLKDVIDILSFIGIVTKQSKLIDGAFCSLKDISKSRLSEEAFGSEVQQISLFGALREFAGALLKQDRNLYQIFAQECPTFFSPEYLQITDITNRLSNCFERGQTPQLADLEKARETFMKYIEQPLQLDAIVSIFKQAKYYKGIIDVCLKKANSLDQNQQALKWYRGDRSTEDATGRSAFDARYECYDFIFDLIEHKPALEMMLSSNDELFHVSLYHRMLNSNHIDDLLSFTTPYIVPFLEEYAPDHLWIYHSRHNNYSKSASQLLEMTINKEKTFQLQQRIQWLKYIVNLADSDGAIGLRNEALFKIKLSDIQLKLRERKESSPDYLLDAQELFDICCKTGQWDLVLKILSCTPIRGDNQKKVISNVWSNFLNEQLWNESLSMAASRIKDAMTSIPPENDVCDPTIVLPVLEEHRLQKDGNVLWATNTMLNSGFDSTLVIIAYINALDNKDISDEIRFDFSYSVAYLFSNGANPRGRDLHKIKDYFVHHAKQRCSYYYDCLKLMQKI